MEFEKKGKEVEVEEIEGEKERNKENRKTWNGREKVEKEGE